MFLAWKEIKHAKAKFGLIMSVIMLISYLVYFLTSLAYGLASSYTNGVNKWQADNIVLTTDANDNIMMSVLDDTDYLSLDAPAVDKARLGLFPAVVRDLGASDPEASKSAVYVFGIDASSFIAPKELNGALADNTVLGDSSLKDLGYAEGDTIRVAGTSLEWTLVGFTSKATYQTAPILYANMATWQEYRFGGAPVTSFNAVVTRGNLANVQSTLLSYTIQKFISLLPGYTAQVLTFSIMIGFLIGIAAFVLAIFIYVLTIQKTSMFGVMKAQGISNRYIGSSVVGQTFIITAIGVAGGLVLTLVSGYFLYSIVPFAINILFYIGITAAFFAFSIFGGLFSVGAVLKIDPLKAIG